MIKLMTKMGLESANLTFYDPEMQRLIKSKTKFDMFIAETFMNECLYSLANYFDAHSASVSTFGPSFWTDMMTGNPNNPSYNGNPFLTFGTPTTFLQRLENTAQIIIEYYLYR